MATLSHGDAQDLLAAFKRGWERRSPDEIIELMDSDIDYRADPFAEPLVGLNAVRELWNNYAATQAHVEFDAEHIWVNGATVLTSWHAAYTRRATAERVRARGFMSMELGDDRRVRRLRQWPVERVVGADRTFEAEAPQVQVRRAAQPQAGPERAAAPEATAQTASRGGEG